MFREVNKKLNKKKRDQSKLKAEDQQNYVDSSRSIAVSLDSKELSRALKHFSKDFVCMNSKTSLMIILSKLKGSHHLKKLGKS